MGLGVGVLVNELLQNTRNLNFPHIAIESFCRCRLKREIICSGNHFSFAVEITCWI